MTDKNLKVRKVMKSLKGQKVTAREISKFAKLTVGETVAQLLKLNDKGLVQRIFVGCHDYDCLWLYVGGDE